MEVAEPFAVGHVALPAREILDVSGVDEDDLEAPRIEDLEDRDPRDAGRLHRDVRDAARRQPLGEAVKIGGERRERLDRRGVAIGGHGDEVLGRAAIDTGGIGVQPFERGGRLARLRHPTTLAFHGASFTLTRPPGTGMRMRGNLLNGIPTRERRVTNDDAANPRTTLTGGLRSTSAGSVSVPGGTRSYRRCGSPQFLA
jgi:hypothetical protein